MIGTRLLEMRRQRTFGVTEFLNTFDERLEAKFHTLVFFVNKKKQEALFFITHHVPFHAWNKAHHLTGGLRKRYEKIERTVRGKNMLHSTGEASVFMKHISEYKHKKSGLRK